jgi:hypothetical protein
MIPNMIFFSTTFSLEFVLPLINHYVLSILSLLNVQTSLCLQSPSLRVAVCEVLGEVLVRVLSGDGLDESGRADRDRFMDTLQEHLHDTHSYVRARVLQVYTRIVNSKVRVCVCLRLKVYPKQLC